MMYDVILPAGIGIVLIFGIGFVLASLYTRSSRDEAYVRTGLGGQKVVLDGGSVVLPIFHSIARVNLKTLRLEVRRGEGDALITKDRMRVDIGAEFYVRVKPDASSIALAAQTLGDRTNDAEAAAHPDRGEIRRRPALGRRDDEARRSAGTAHGFRQGRAGSGRRRSAVERPRTRIRVADDASTRPTSSISTPTTSSTRRALRR